MLHESSERSMNGGVRDCRRPLRLPLCWVLLILLDVCLVAFAWAHAGAQEHPAEQSAQIPQVTETVIEGPQQLPENAVRFEALDVFVDSGLEPLAAWQLELMSRHPDVQIVGIEGGEHAAFSEPPYYDPKAIRHHRVRIAAFSTDTSLPQGRSRVARIHVQCTGPGPREWLSELTASATRGGVPIHATLSIARAEG